MRDPWVTRMRNLPATVVSTTLEGPLDWPDATVVSGDAVDVVARLKEESEVPLRSHGSLSMNRALMAAGLVDRVQVTIFPVITGQTGTGPDLPGCGRLRPRADREPDARRPHPRAHLPAHPALTRRSSPDCADSVRMSRTEVPLCSGARAPVSEQLIFNGGVHRHVGPADAKLGTGSRHVIPVVGTEDQPVRQPR